MILTILNLIALYLLGGFITVCITIRLEGVDPDEGSAGCLIMSLWPFFVLFYALPLLACMCGTFFYRLGRKVVGK